MTCVSERCIDWSLDLGLAVDADRARIMLTSKVVEDKTGCWIWQLAKDRDGYGTTWWLGRGWRAHRLSYAAHTGPIPHGDLILHKCDNRACINPLHLSSGTHIENMRDMTIRGRRKGVRHRTKIRQ